MSSRASHTMRAENMEYKFNHSFRLYWRNSSENLSLCRHPKVYCLQRQTFTERILDQYDKRSALYLYGKGGSFPSPHRHRKETNGRQNYRSRLHWDVCRSGNAARIVNKELTLSQCPYHGGHPLRCPHSTEKRKRWLNC